MARWDSHVIRIEPVARDTVAVHFQKPEGFDFRPGQTVSLTLPPSSDADTPLRHTFSLVSAPHEADLCITTRLRPTPYKQALAALEKGAALQLSGPHGRFGLPDETGRPIVLIAGGIGITPFMSMLRSATHAGSTQRFLLLYSNRRPDDAAFLDELRDLAGMSPNFRLQATFTAAEGLDTGGLRGRIDATLLGQALQGLSEPLCYLTGTPDMVDDLHDLLIAQGLDEAAIRAEGFGGY